MRRRWLFLIALALVLAGPALVRAADEEPTAEQLAQFYGRTVTKLDWDIPFYMDATDIKRVCKIKSGRRFMRWRTRDTLRNFNLLDEVENAAILAKADGPDGVRVKVKIYPRYIIRDIRVVGNRSYNVSEVLLDILRLEPGDDYHEEMLDVYKQKILDALASAGHMKATVKIDVLKTKRGENNQVDLRIKINERPTFEVVRFDFSDADLGIHNRQEMLQIAGWHRKMDFSQPKIDRGIARLKKWLKANGYLEARVPDLSLEDPDAYHIDQGRSQITVNFPLKIGPRIDIYYDNACFTCAEMKWKFEDVLGLGNQRRFNKWIARDFADKLKVYFQRKGYHLVVVHHEYREFKTPGGEPVKEMRFSAEKGPKVSIRSITFRENEAFKNEELVKQLKERDVYVEEDFAKDLDNVISFYNRAGFLKAKIAQKAIEYDEEEHKLDITVVVDEGVQTILRTLTFVGPKAVSEGKLRKALDKTDEPMQTGKPFNPFLLQKAKTVVLSEYLKRGYAKARVKEKFVFNEDQTELEIVLTITEGKLYRFGNIYLRGNKLTKKHIIRRELVLVEGDPYNFEKVFRSEQALVQLGFFNSVDISPVDPEMDDTDVDMLVTVNERKSGYITGGVGYNTFTGYNAAFEVGHRNLAGYGRRLSFRFEGWVKPPSPRLDQRATTINFTWPWIARVPLDGTLTVSDGERSEIAYDVRSFTVTIGTTLVWRKMFNFLEATHKDPKVRDMASRNHGFVDPFTMEFDWELAKDFIYNIDPAVTDQERGEIQISTLSPILIHDLRDHPFNPTRWTYNTIRFDYGPPWFLSQIHYLKVTGRTSWYFPIFEILPWLNGWVFAENVVVGHLQALRDTDTVPISRRFFLGGSISMRGFGQNQISPMGSDGKTPVGGYFLAYQNTELRIPLNVANLGILTFLDAGNVTNSSADYDINQVRAASGLGLSYLTPIGPISAVYGAKLNRRADESFGEFYISIGNAF